VWCWTTTPVPSRPPPAKPWANTTRLRLTLTEGKYHQVKRMLAAVGNRVEGLHRSQVGGFRLPADLAPGQWRWLTPDDLAAITG
jgi:16S rRNA pseudouridine516 synthase